MQTLESERTDISGVSICDLADRREHRRVEQGAAAGQQTTVQNVSLGGICLKLDEPAEQGTRFTLLLSEVRSNSSQEMDVEVVWSRRGRAGLRWVEQTPEQFLWLCDHLGFWWSSGIRFSAAIVKRET